MSARSFLFFSLLFTAACAKDASDEPAANAESDLTASRIQLLGTIASGATTNVHYTSTPYFYRAYSFTATKGDQIDASVTTDDGEPVAYLLRSSFSTVERDTGGHVVATIPSTGTYYLAFREMEGDTTDFTVSFTKTGSTPPPPPPPPLTTDDAFDPASCTGVPLDFASKFAPGAAEAVLADYQIVLRKRQCNSVTGCSAWQSTTEHAGPSGHGKATLAVNPPRLVLVGDEASSAYGTPKIELGTECTLGNGNTTATCSNYYVTEITHGAWPYLVGPHERHYRIGNSGVGSYHVDGDNVALSGTITNGCARLVAHPSKPDAIYPDAPYTDFEAAILIRY